MADPILVPRAYDPYGLRQESRALGATISGMRHRCRCAVSRITRIRLFPLFFHNGCSQSSRFLPQARRIVGSGVENGPTQVVQCARLRSYKILLIITPASHACYNASHASHASHARQDPSHASHRFNVK